MKLIQDTHKQISVSIQEVHKEVQRLLKAKEQSMNEAYFYALILSFHCFKQHNELNLIWRQSLRCCTSEQYSKISSKCCWFDKELPCISKTRNRTWISTWKITPASNENQQTIQAYQLPVHPSSSNTLSRFPQGIDPSVTLEFVISSNWIDKNRQLHIEFLLAPIHACNEAGLLHNMSSFQPGCLNKTMISK